MHFWTQVFWISVFLRSVFLMISLWRGAVMRRRIVCLRRVAVCLLVPPLCLPTPFWLYVIQLCWDCLGAKNSFPRSILIKYCAKNVFSIKYKQKFAKTQCKIHKIIPIAAFFHFAASANKF